MATPYDMDGFFRSLVERLLEESPALNTKVRAAAEAVAHSRVREMLEEAVVLAEDVRGLRTVIREELGLQAPATIDADSVAGLGEYVDDRVRDLTPDLEAENVEGLSDFIDEHLQETNWQSWWTDMQSKVEDLVNLRVDQAARQGGVRQDLRAEVRGHVEQWLDEVLKYRVLDTLNTDEVRRLIRSIVGPAPPAGDPTAPGVQNPSVRDEVRSAIVDLVRGALDAAVPVAQPAEARKAPVLTLPDEADVVSTVTPPQPVYVSSQLAATQARDQSNRCRVPGDHLRMALLHIDLRTLTSTDRMVEITEGNLTEKDAAVLRGLGYSVSEDEDGGWRITW